MLHTYTDLEVRVREFARKARRDEGATMVEYGLLVALIAVALIAAVIALSDGIGGVFGEAAGQLEGAVG